RCDHPIDGEGDPGQDRHLRLRPADAGREAGVVLRLRPGDDREDVRKRRERKSRKTKAARGRPSCCYLARCRAQTFWMLEACFPLGPCTTSKLTFCPSFSVLNPDMLMAEKWAKRSSLPSSGVMNPYPFASLNHFTVPVAMCSP